MSRVLNWMVEGGEVWTPADPWCLLTDEGQKVYEAAFLSIPPEAVEGDENTPPHFLHGTKSRHYADLLAIRHTVEVEKDPARAMAYVMARAHQVHDRAHWVAKS